ncbi:hypothetical protein D9M71_483200 [compost metagenome]
MQQPVDVGDVALAVLVGNLEAVVVEDPLQRPAQVALRAVQAGVRVAVAGAQRGACGVHEHGAVADVVVAEQPAEDRVEPGFRQFVVRARVDQADVGALDDRPALHVGQFDAGKRRHQPAHRLGDLHLVQVDPLSRGALGLLPLRPLEARRGFLGDLLETRAVVVEALQDALRDLGGRPVLGHGGVSRQGVLRA